MDSQKIATQIVEKLVCAGHIAYFAGGWVRDYLMGHPSNDIDIATDASPDKILDLFPRTIPVGLAFGVVIVLVDGHQFEISTFRKDLGYIDGRRPEQIEFSSAEEDAKRRDFTINGMFYDPLEKVVHDYVHGAVDLKRRVICAIGDPQERFIEDRLRMIRAVRFATRFGFTIEPETEEAIIENADTLLPAVAMERVWQELNKMADAKDFGVALAEMYRLGLLSVIFPILQHVGLHEIRNRVALFEFFPKETSTILYILELFPDTSLDELIEICRYLKVSNQDVKSVEFMVLAHQLIAREEKGSVDILEWIYFYAHSNAQKFLEIIASRYSKEKRESFLKSHEERQERLKVYIQRVQLKKPLVSAALLQTHGVSPGKPMGALLKEAERLSINHHREDAEEIIALLKQSLLWPKGGNK